MARPARNYETLFQEFSTTELSRRDFLRQRGINPSCGSASRNTSDWETRRIKLYLVGNEPTREFADYSSLTVDPSLSEPPMREILETNVDCDKLAQILSQQLELILLNNCGSRTAEPLTVNDIAKLTSVLAQLQLIRQRAKGVWGQNIPKNSEGNIAYDKPLAAATFQAPIYEVQIDKSGKFKRARPTLVGYHEVNPEDGCDADDQIQEKSIYQVELINPETGKYEPIKPRKAKSLNE